MKKTIQLDIAEMIRLLKETHNRKKKAVLFEVTVGGKTYEIRKDRESAG